jgi:hypothetical protein
MHHLHVPFSEYQTEMNAPLVKKVKQMILLSSMVRKLGQLFQNLAPYSSRELADRVSGALLRSTDAYKSMRS